MLKRTMFEFGKVKSHDWLGFFIGHVAAITKNDNYRVPLDLNKEYMFDKIESLAADGFSWKLIEKESKEVILDGYKLGNDLNYCYNMPVLLNYDLTQDGITDPIFFEEGKIVKMIMYKGLDIMLVAEGFKNIDITDLEGNKLNSWEEVYKHYPNDEEFNKFLNSDYCDGIELPRYTIHVFLNRFLNPIIDKYMDQHDMTIQNRKYGIRIEFVIGDPNNLFDFDEVFQHAITYKDFCELPTKRPEIFETLFESYNEYLPQ